MCVRVSSAFYEAFSPGIWVNFKLNRREFSMDMSVLKSHAPKIRSMKVLFIEAIAPQYSRLTFENLVDLSLDIRQCTYLASPENLIRMIRLNPTIKSLAFANNFIRFPAIVWKTVSSTLNNPKILRLYSQNIQANAADSFWTMCTRFEEIHVDQSRIPTPLLGYQLARLRSLTLNTDSYDKEWFALEDIVQMFYASPGLEELRWYAISSASRLQPSSDLETPALPSLLSMDLYGRWFSKEHVAFLVGNAPLLKNVEVHSAGWATTFEEL
ncbi:hypothetical protein BGX28_006314 [Mortierella sp. GBA30]|nr:hypothetical protein BGX28_006314 [Mortierella sp. GBA30]